MLRRFIAPAVLLGFITGLVAAPQLVSAAAPIVGKIPADLEVDVLDEIPGDAVGLVTAHHILESKESVESLLDTLGVPYDDGDYAEFSDFLEGLEGWDDEGTHAFAFFMNEDQSEPRVAVFVPVTNYKQFARSLGADPDVGGITEFEIEDGPKGFIVQKGDFAVVGPPSDEGGRDTLEAILESKQSIAASSAPIRSWIGEYPVAGVLTPAGIQLFLGKAIEGLEEVKESFENGLGGNDPTQAATVAAVFEFYLSGLKAVRDEATHLTVGGVLDEEAGIRYAGQVVFKADGRFAAASKNVPPLPTEVLDGLPAGDFCFAGAGVLPAEWVTEIMEISMKLVAKLPEEIGGLQWTDDEMKEMIADAQVMAKQLRYMAMSLNSSGAGVFGGMSGYYKVDDADAFMASYEKSMKKTIEMMKKADAANTPQQEIERRRIGDLDVLVVTTDMDAAFEQMAAQQPQMKAIMQGMFGNEGKLVAYVAAVDKKTVAITYAEPMLKTLAADLKSGRRGLGDNVQMQKTAALFPKSPHWIGFLSVGGTVELVRKVAADVMAAMGQGGFPLPIPPFPESPPVGFAARVTPTTIEAHVVVPMDLMTSTRDYVQQMQAMFGGGLR